MIVTPFEVGDSRETVKARLVGIIEFYKGAGTADNLTTWGDARALLNDLVPNFPLIANGESGASVRAKLNEFHNDPELVALVNPEGTVFKTAEGKVLIRPASPE